MYLLSNPMGALRFVDAVAVSGGPTLPGSFDPGPPVGPGATPPFGPGGEGPGGGLDKSECNRCRAKEHFYQCKPGTDECQEWGWDCTLDKSGRTICNPTPGSVVDGKLCTPACSAVEKLPEG